MGSLESPSIWSFEFRENPSKHVVLLAVHPEEADEFYFQLKKAVGQSQKKEAFVFIPMGTG